MSVATLTAFEISANTESKNSAKIITLKQLWV
jgi:hypothetical protein